MQIMIFFMHSIALYCISCISVVSNTLRNLCVFNHKSSTWANFSNTCCNDFVLSQPYDVSLTCWQTILKVMPDVRYPDLPHSWTLSQTSLRKSYTLPQHGMNRACPLKKLGWWLWEKSQQLAFGYLSLEMKSDAVDNEIKPKPQGTDPNYCL